MPQPLLISEPPLQVLRSLAVIVGLERAIVIQQMYFLLTRTPCKEHKDEKWVSYTYAEWKSRQFPFWSERTIERLFESLETMQIVTSCQPDGFVRTKYYRLNHGMVNLMLKGKIHSQDANLAESVQAASLTPSEAANLADSHTNKKRVIIPKEPAAKSSGYVVPACFEKVDGFTLALAAWIEARKKKSNPPTGYAIQLLINRLSERPNNAIAALHLCIEHGWASVKWDWFDNYNRGSNGKNGTHPVKTRL